MVDCKVIKTLEVTKGFNNVGTYKIGDEVTVKGILGIHKGKIIAIEDDYLAIEDDLTGKNFINFETICDFN